MLASTFENASMPWQAATVFFAVIDLVAAVGLWLAAAWGGVVWLTAAISMAAIELFFPQVYGGRLWIAIPEFLMSGTHPILVRESRDDWKSTRPEPAVSAFYRKDGCTADGKVCNGRTYDYTYDYFGEKSVGRM